MTAQATRHARRIYVGGVAPTTTEADVTKFFNNALVAVNGANGEEGPPVVNSYINVEKKFSFVEFRSVEETSNALALDGVVIDGVGFRAREGGSDALERADDGLRAREGHDAIV